MSPGLLAQIKEEWRHCYRAPGAPMAGVIQAISPSGSVARIRLDDVADSYILVSHLEPALPAEVTRHELLSVA
jgi:hypothetical protein